MSGGFVGGYNSKTPSDLRQAWIYLNHWPSTHFYFLSKIVKTCQVIDHDLSLKKTNNYPFEQNYSVMSDKTKYRQN